MFVETRLARFAGRSSATEDAKDAADKKPTARLQLAHVRVSLFFLAFFNLGFFGCGNVASISSVSCPGEYHFARRILPLILNLYSQFYLEPVYRLMTIFAPFPMVRPRPFSSARCGRRLRNARC